MTSDRPDRDPTPPGGFRSEDAPSEDMVDEVVLDTDLATRLAEVDPADPQRREQAVTAALREFDTAPWRAADRRRPRWQLASIAAAALLVVGGGIAAFGIRSTPSDDLASSGPAEAGFSAMAGDETDEPARLAAPAPEQAPEIDDDLASAATSEPLLGAIPAADDGEADPAAPPSESPAVPGVIETPEALAEFAATTPARSASVPACAPAGARGIGPITYAGVSAVAIAMGDDGMVHAIAADDCRILATVTVASRPTTD